MHTGHGDLVLPTFGGQGEQIVAQRYQPRSEQGRRDMRVNGHFFLTPRSNQRSIAPAHEPRTRLQYMTPLHRIAHAEARRRRAYGL